MPHSAREPVSLPPGLTLDEAQTVAVKYAPLLRLHADEHHLPDDPDRFRHISRFRQSRPGRDLGWSDLKQSWLKGNQGGPEFHDIPWDRIVAESGRIMTEQDDRHTPRGANLRPRDDANVFGKGSTRGLFLQRNQALGDDASGRRPRADDSIDAPVFIDIVHQPEKKVVRVLYWFFYELNHWRFMITHEGDWEHITLIFDEQAFAAGAAPEAVYFAQHDGGHPLAFDQLESYEGTHPVIYVHRHGHPCHARVENPALYRLLWKTWLVEHVSIPLASWRDYAGGWGEVGEFKFTTGPLGPFFKRTADNVRIVVIDGKPYIRFK